MTEDQALEAFSEIVAQASKRSTRPETVSAKVIQALSLKTKQQLLDILYPLIDDEVRGRLRIRVRILERVADGGQPPSGAAGVGVSTNVMQAKKDLLHERFYSPVQNGYVTWGDATVEDHESYADMLRGQIDALSDNIERHDDAVALIKKAGALCLFDLGDKALAIAV